MPFAMQNPTIVIVPGAWQKPVAWHEAIRQLRAAGFRVEYVPLATVGGTTLPLAQPADDIASVRVVLRKLAREQRKAIMLAHSGGGLIASNAAEGMSNIAGIIHMSAFMIPTGQSIYSMLGGKPLPWMRIEVGGPW